MVGSIGPKAPRFGKFTEKQMKQFMKHGVYNHLKKSTLVTVMGLYQTNENLYNPDQNLISDIFDITNKEFAKGINKALSDRTKEYTPKLEEAFLKAPFDQQPGTAAAAAESLALLYADKLYDTQDSLFNNLIEQGGFKKTP